MSKNAQLKKKVRQEVKMKKAKQKKKIVIIVLAVLLIALAIAIAISLSGGDGTETYSDGHQTLKLFPDGTFTVELFHGFTRNGSYVKTEGEKAGVTSIMFFTEEGYALGEIEDGVFHIPDDWADDHGHGSELRKQ